MYRKKSGKKGNTSARVWFLDLDSKDFRVRTLDAFPEFFVLAAATFIGPHVRFDNLFEKRIRRRNAQVCPRGVGDVFSLDAVPLPISESLGIEVLRNTSITV